MFLELGISMEIVGAALMVFAAAVVFGDDYDYEHLPVLRGLVYSGAFLVAFGAALAVINMVQK